MLKQLSQKPPCEEALPAIYLHLTKSITEPLLEGILKIQCFHNEVKYEENFVPTIRKLQKHLQEIFVRLRETCQQKKPDAFVECLSEEIKNLAARLGKVGALDKKVERQIKSTLMSKFKDTAAALQAEDASSEYKAFYNALQYQAVR